MPIGLLKHSDISSENFILYRKNFYIIRKDKYILSASPLHIFSYNYHSIIYYSNFSIKFNVTQQTEQNHRPNRLKKSSPREKTLVPNYYTELQKRLIRSALFSLSLHSASCCRPRPRFQSAELLQAQPKCRFPNSRLTCDISARGRVSCRADATRGGSFFTPFLYHVFFVISFFHVSCIVY